MLRHYHRIAPAIALTLALAAAAPASAKFELNPVAGTQTQSSSPASTSVCSEVCSAGGYGNPGAPSKVVRVVAPSSGFHWGDAGIGAGGAFALTMLALGGVLAATNTRRRASRSSAQPTT
jgi:hypothetical protein